MSPTHKTKTSCVGSKSESLQEPLGCPAHPTKLHFVIMSGAIPRRRVVGKRTLAAEVLQLEAVDVMPPPPLPPPATPPRVDGESAAAEIRDLFASFASDSGEEDDPDMTDVHQEDMEPDARTAELEFVARDGKVFLDLSLDNQVAACL